MVDLLLTLDFWGIMWEIVIDGETEMERSASIHALVRVNCEDEVEEIVWIRKGCLHSFAQGALELS